ncbi:TniB family NTP-binding protein [Bradyrhizobium sp. CNPSo 4019]|uniref:TniB family NTP-binding protein n=2 Tax=Bradyrhizobium diversitatis TaxID=2755406 RepID=A0ABS0NVG3_9BRAD|nr:TniB family NTP-binding protein [Bradyrhizobium diversitatis]
MGMSDEHLHLHPSTRRFADEDAQSRIRRIRTDRWIGYARAEAVLAALEDLLSFPRRTRMPNLLLVGPTNNGKTMIVEMFRRAHPGTAAEGNDDGMALLPVVKVQMPSGPDEGRFFGAILDALGMPFSPRDRIAAKQDTAVRVMRAAGTRMLVIDELHNVLSGSAMQQRRLLNLLRWLGNELQIPLVGVGTAEALRAIRSDDQLVNRFQPYPLPLWSDDEEYRRLLSTLEAVLPLRKPSHLADTALAARILSASEGVLGEMIAIIIRAAVRAVDTGAEAISARVIEDTGFIRPSERRRVAV